MLTVVAYDIEDDLRRARVAQILEDHGCRVQFSVFECELPAGRFEIVRQALETVVDPARDRLGYYRLCAACRGRIRRIPPPAPGRRPGGTGVF